MVHDLDNRFRVFMHELLSHIKDHWQTVIIAGFIVTVFAVLYDEFKMKK